MKKLVVRKIHDLKTEGFRGFVQGAEAHTLNVDADIVLLAGPNGFGKTSFLQSLTLLLTGHAELNPEELFSFKADLESGSSNTNTTSTQSIRIQANVSLGDRDAKENNGQTNQGRQGPNQATLELNWHPGDPAPRFSGSLPGWPRTLWDGSNGVLPTDEDQAKRHEKKLADARRILARVTSYYPERVDSLFETLTTGSTLRDIFYPEPEAVRVARKRLEEEREKTPDLLARIKRAIQPRHELEQMLDTAQRALAQRWMPVREVTKILKRRHSARPNDSTVSILEDLDASAAPTLETFVSLLRRLAGGRTIQTRSVGKELLDTLDAMLDVELLSAQQKATKLMHAERLLAELDSLNECLATIDKRFPKLEAELRCFATDTRHPGLPDLLAVLRSVAENSEGWLKRVKGLAVTEQNQVLEVVLELQAVRPDNARKRALVLEQWLLPRQAAAAERAALSMRKQEVEQLLRGYRESEDVRQLSAAKRTLRDSRKAFQPAYEDLYRAQRAIELQSDLGACARELEQLQVDLNHVIEVLKTATSANEHILKQTLNLAQQVLARFSIVRGVLPLKVELQATTQKDDSSTPHSIIKTNTGLALSQLSTGQRSQTSVSLAVAQSELLRRASNVDLPFFVLLLDDVSTAYDLSNLTREAILWRQLAYHKIHSRRWQLFISSHHEDMTNHLLDLLVPPKDATLRILRFTGWSPTNGPEIEQFSVEPSQGLTPEVREYIKNGFKEELCQAS